MNRRNGYEEIIYQNRVGISTFACGNSNSDISAGSDGIYGEEKGIQQKTVRSILDKLEDGLKLKKVKKIMKISLGKPTTEKVDVLGVGKRTYKHYYLRYYCKNTNVIVGFDPEKGYTKSPQANYIDVHLVFYKDKLWLWENKGGGYLIETQEEPPMTDFKEQ
jgi:hypothetical protein